MKYLNKIKYLILVIMLCCFSNTQAQIIADGIYQIYSETHNASLESPTDVNQDDSGDSTINNLFGSTSDITNDYQLFEFIHQGSDVYKIKNIGTDQFIGIKDNWCGDGGEVIARYLETDSNVEFSVSQNVTTGQFVIQIAFTTCNFGSVNSPLRSFDLGGATNKLKTFGDTGANQQFRLINTSPVINDGIYQIFSEVNNEALESPTDVNQDDSVDGQINNLFATTSNASNDYQQFEFNYKYTNNNGDVYNIRNLGTNQYVGLKDDWCGDSGEVIARFNETDNESQIVVSINASAHYLFQKDGNCSNFDLAGGGSGARIRTFNDTGANQQFRLLNTSRVVVDGTYRIFSEVHNEFLESPTDVNQDDTADSTINNLFASALDYSDTYQQFEFNYQYTDDNGDIYLIKNIGTDLYVGLKDDWCGDNGEVIARFNASEGEIIVSQNESGHYLFRNNNESNCSYFDLAGGGSGARIRTFNDTGVNQQYRLISDASFIYDNAWLSSTPTGNGGEDIFILNGTYTTSADVTFNSILVSSDAGVEISSTDVLTLTESLTNNGSFTFKSDNNGSAQLADATDVIIRGDVTVERYIPATNRAFRFLASPVTTTDFIFENWQDNGSTPFSPNGIGTHITGPTPSTANGLDDSPNDNPSMFTFDNTFTGTQGGATNSAWNAITNTKNTKLEAGIPYLVYVRGDRSIDLAATTAPAANATTLSATGNITTGGNTQTLSEITEYFSLVANPYQAIVQFDQLAFTGIVNPNFMYVYDPSVLDYVELNAAVPADLANMYINPGQSFFVVNDNTTNSTSTAEFQQTNINTNGTSTTVFSNDLTMLSLKLFDSSNSLRERLRFSFVNNASNNINNFDGPKLPGNTEVLASINEGNIYAFEQREIVESSDVIPLSLNQYQDISYEFRIDLDNWYSNIDIFIKDNYLNTTTQITPDQAFAFSVDDNIPASIAEDRFSLVLNNTTLGVKDNVFGEGFILYPNPCQNGHFSITTPQLRGDVQIKISNLLGQQISFQKLSIEEQQVNVNIGNISSGIYIVNLTQYGQSFNFKLIIE
jgi:hypothetical protein